jgi:hypothetical protein
VALVTDHAGEAAEASGPTPSLLTIRAGGPFDGAVTISTVDHENSRVRVEAVWTRDGELRSVSAIVGGAQAQLLARAATDALAAGREPRLPPDQA